MGWSFRKRVTIAPGIRLNFSKSGISTSVGPRGASINISKKGVYSNLSIPGTGIYKREKIYGSSDSKKQSQNNISRKTTTPQPTNIAISTLLKYKNVIEPNTLKQLQTFLDSGESYVYVEPGVLSELRRLHNERKNPPTKPAETKDDVSTTEAVFGLLSLVFGVICGCVAHFAFNVPPFPSALISVVPLTIALLVSKCKKQ